MRVTRTVAEASYYQLLVSVRKRVECLFGALKMRFRILKTPMLFKTKQRVDDVMFTCCRLHNKLGDARGDRTKWDDLFDDTWSDQELRALRKKLKRHTSLAKMVARITGVDFDASASGAHGCHTPAELRVKHCGYADLQRKLIAHCTAADRKGTLLHAV